MKNKHIKYIKTIKSLCGNILKIKKLQFANVHNYPIKNDYNINFVIGFNILPFST